MHSTAHITNPAAVVQTADDVQPETERQLIDRARAALSNCHWTVGECASLWCKRYSKGRGDADFGAMVGLSADQVCQRRLVWGQSGEERDTYHTLSWSHFYVSLKWPNQSECLEWAVENEASVAEMRAWYRMQGGEDLTDDTAEQHETRTAEGETDEGMGSTSGQQEGKATEGAVTDDRGTARTAVPAAETGVRQDDAVDPLDDRETAGRSSNAPARAPGSESARAARSFVNAFEEFIQSVSSNIKILDGEQRRMIEQRLVTLLEAVKSA